MLRLLSASLAFLLAACSSSSSSNGSGGSASCPDVSGSWKITQHCDASLVGQSAVVTQNGCSLTFAAPFNGFTGTVTTDDKITISGPQTCTGTASATAISMSCTPGTCAVTMSR